MLEAYSSVYCTFLDVYVDFCGGGGGGVFFFEYFFLKVFFLKVFFGVIVGDSVGRVVVIMGAAVGGSVDRRGPVPHSEDRFHELNKPKAEAYCSWAVCAYMVEKA